MNQPSPGSCGTPSLDPRPVRIDPEFAALVLPPAPGELPRLHDSLRAQGCRDPILVWPYEDLDLVVDGHKRLPFCRDNDIPFAIEPRAFANRTAVEQFIVTRQLERHNVTAEGVAYLRGKRYLAEKQRQGWPYRHHRRRAQYEHMRTAERLGLEYRVAAVTIRRDAEFATAIDMLAANCGPEARDAILARDCGLCRGAALRLCKLPLVEQQSHVEHLLEHGKLPHGTGAPTHVTLPLEPEPFAGTLVRKRGVKDSLVILDALATRLGRRVTAE